MSELALEVVRLPTTMVGWGIRLPSLEKGGTGKPDARASLCVSSVVLMIAF